MKKGWCPTLTRPMETGDGWLVRLHLKDHALSAALARAVADCAARYGNGHLDLTSRANLQIRGVTPETCAPLLEELHALGVTDAPRPPRRDEELELGARDGGVALGLAFGRIESERLAWLAQVSERYGNATIALQPGRILFLPDVTNAEQLLEEARAHGFLIRGDDPLRRIQACPGAPACASAEGETRSLALAIAAAFPHLSRSVHVSGCAKGCACAAKTDITLVARAGSYGLSFDAKASDAPAHAGLTAREALDVLRKAA